MEGFEIKPLGFFILFMSIFYFHLFIVYFIRQFLKYTAAILTNPLIFEVASALGFLKTNYNYWYLQ